MLINHKKNLIDEWKMCIAIHQNQLRFRFVNKSFVFFSFFYLLNKPHSHLTLLSLTFTIAWYFFFSFLLLLLLSLLRSAHLTDTWYVWKDKHNLNFHIFLFFALKLKNEYTENITSEWIVYNFATNFKWSISKIFSNNCRFYFLI